jgi:hypothetical protein
LIYEGISNTASYRYTISFNTFHYFIKLHGKKGFCNVGLLQNQIIFNI